MRIRKINRHLPPRVYLKHNAYWFVVPHLNSERKNQNKWIRLGKTQAEALAKWATLIDKPTTNAHSIMSHLFDRYMLEIAPLKAPNTYKANKREIGSLRDVFGDMSPNEITPVDIYKYLDLRKQQGAPVGANREKSLLSHVFSMAIRWGAISDNPCRHVKRNTEKPSKRYIQDDEFIAFHQFVGLLKSGLVIQGAMELAYIIGQRKGDIFKIRRSDLKEEGIDLEQNKTSGRTGKTYIVTWTPELKDCVNKILAIPRPVLSLYLFSTRKGRPYTTDGISSIWDRYMEKALEQGIIKERFTFKDIRAKRASDSESLEQASKLLGHTTTGITRRVYMRKPEKISPKTEGHAGILLDKLGYIRQIEESDDKENSGST